LGRSGELAFPALFFHRTFSANKNGFPKTTAAVTIAAA